MIVFGEDKYKPGLMELWKLCFPDDTDEFVRFYFDKVYKNDESLILFDKGQAAAFLQMIPYPVKFDSHIAQAGYISGAMTHPASRKKGYMQQLLTEAFHIMQERAFAYTFLIPQEEWLFTFYGKYGYVPAFPQYESTVLIPDFHYSPQVTLLRDKSVRHFSSFLGLDLSDAYSVYYRFLTAKDRVVLKTPPHFSNILQDLFIDGGSLFFNDWGILFALPGEDHVVVKEFFYFDGEIKNEFVKVLQQAYPGKELLWINDPATPFVSYKGMIKSFDNSPIDPFIYMSMMLD